MNRDIDSSTADFKIMQSKMIWNWKHVQLGNCKTVLRTRWLYRLTRSWEPITRPHVWLSVRSSQSAWLIPIITTATLLYVTPFTITECIKIPVNISKKWIQINEVSYLPTICCMCFANSKIWQRWWGTATLTSTNVLQIRNWRVLLNIRGTDTSFSLTRWQQKDVMVAILKLWYQIKNPTLPVDPCLCEEHSCQISSWSDLKW